MEIRYRPLDFRRLRDLIDARRVLEQMGWRPTCRGARDWRGPCPFHGSSHPRSVSLSVGPRVIFCFICKWDGDGIEAWKWHKKLTVLRAAHELCEVLSIAKPYVDL
jgi:hypothetical protein